MTTQTEPKKFNMLDEEEKKEALDYGWLVCPVCKERRGPRTDRSRDVLWVNPEPGWNGCCSKECARVMVQVQAMQLVSTAVGGLLEHLSHGTYMWSGETDVLAYSSDSNPE